MANQIRVISFNQKLFFILLIILLSSCGHPNSSTNISQTNQLLSPYDVVSETNISILPTRIATKTPSPPEQLMTSIPTPPGGESGWSFSPENMVKISVLYQHKSAPVGQIQDIAWSPDGKVLAAAGKHGLVLLDGATLEIQEEIKRRVQVSQISFSANGKRLAGVNMLLPAVEVWDVTSGESQGIFPNAGYRAALSPNGEWLAVVEDSPEIDQQTEYPPTKTTLKVYEIKTGNLLHSMSANTAFAQWNPTPLETIGLFFSPDGNKIQSVTNFGDVRLWDLKIGRLVNSSINNETRVRLNNGICETSGLSGKTFAIACTIQYIDPPCTEDDPNCQPNFTSRLDIGLWATDQIKRYQLQSIKEPGGNSSGFSFSPEINAFLRMDFDGTIRMQEYGKINDISNFKTKHSTIYASRINEKINPIPLIKMQPGKGNSSLASVLNDEIQLIDLQGKVRSTFTSPANSITCAELVQVDNMPAIALGYSTGDIKIFRPEENSPFLIIPDAHEGSISQIRYDEELQSIISAGSDNIIRQWDFQGKVRGNPISYVSNYGPFGTDFQFEYYPQTHKVAYIKKNENNPASSDEINLLLLSTNKYTDEHSLGENAKQLSFSRDGNWLAFINANINLWSVSKGEKLREFKPPMDAYSVNDISLSPDASLMAAAQKHQSFIWNVNDSEIILTNSFESNPLRLDFSPDGCLMAVGELSGQISMIDLQNGEIVHQWWEHAGAIHQLAFSQNGRLLISFGDDGLVNVWGVEGALALPAGGNLDYRCKFASPPTLVVPAVPTSTSNPALATTVSTPPEYSRKLMLSEPRMSGNDVYLLQLRLKEMGYTAIGTPDGFFGPITDKVVRQYQADFGLEADGIVGPKTWQSLFP